MFAIIFLHFFWYSLAKNYEFCFVNSSLTQNIFGPNQNVPLTIFDPNLRFLAKHCLFYYPMFVNGAFATLCFVSIVPIGPLKNICFRFRVTPEKRLRPFFLSAGQCLSLTDHACFVCGVDK